jgi:hypothetical protein
MRRNLCVRHYLQVTLTLGVIYLVKCLMGLHKNIQWEGILVVGLLSKLGNVLHVTAAVCCYGLHITEGNNLPASCRLEVPA